MRDAPGPGTTRTGRATEPSDQAEQVELYS